MQTQYWLRLAAVLLLTLVPAGLILADDDDDDDDDHDEIGLVDRTHGASPRMLVPAGNAAWRTECAACHTLYQPALLPARSWEKMMTGLAEHFGENATLDTRTRVEITGFLVANAAGRSGGRGARIAETIPPAQTPLRITDTMYFKRKHHELSVSVYKRPKIGSPANCMACHPGANAGDFAEDRVKVPR